MKTFNIAALSSTVALAASVAFSPVQADNMDSYIESALISVCKSTMKNSPLGLSLKMSEYRLKYATVAEKVVCNGENIMDFALTHNAHKTYGLFQQRTRGHVQIKDIAGTTSGKIYVTFVE